MLVMPEKLLTLEEASALIGFSEEAIRGLVDKGELPAYRIGGKFLRFRREQLEAIVRELPSGPDGGAAVARSTKAHFEPKKDYSYRQTAAEKARDFFYFNDFYIYSLVAIIVILWFIFRS